MDSNIEIAVAFEGPAEIDTVRILLERLFNPVNIIIVDSVFPHTGLIGYIPAYLKRFSETSASLYVFFTDLDGDNNRVAAVNKIINAHPEHAERTVCALSAPHFEAWLVADQNAVKSVLGIAHDEPIPFSEYPPKRQLELLQRDMPEGAQKTMLQLRNELAETIDLNVVNASCSDFKKFTKSLSASAKLLI